MYLRRVKKARLRSILEDDVQRERSQPASRLYIREKQSLSLFYPLRDSPVMPPNRDVGIRAISANRA